MKGLPRDGFAVLPGFFSPQQMTSLKRRAQELIDEHQDEIARNNSVFSTKRQAGGTKDEYFMSSGAEVRFFMEEADATVVNKIG
jgi:hypothetical protein